MKIFKYLQLGSNKDQKLLHQLDFEDNQTIQVRMVTPSSTASTSQSKEVSLISLSVSKKKVELL